MKFPHKAILLVLILLLAGTVYAAFSGTFQIYNQQGILSGPFSALLILAAIEISLLSLVALDWRVWQPQRRRRKQEFARWLSVDVLGQAAPAPEWTELRGQFRGRDVSIQHTGRDGNSAVLTMTTQAPLVLRAVRLEQAAAVAAAGDFSTGDAAFDEKYAWQAPAPEQALALLKNNAARAALKRLASLVADREATPSKGGISLQDGALTVTQAPAFWLNAADHSPQEILLILHDLHTVATCAEGGAPPTSVDASAAPPGAATNSGGWGTIFVVGGFWLALWLGVTYLLGRFVSLSAAMVSFFVPPVVLALWFMAAAGGMGRDPEIDDALRQESSEATRRYADLAALLQRFKMPA